MAVTIDATGTEAFTANPALTSTTYTGITVGSGSNLALVIVIDWGANSSGANPTSRSVVWDSGGTNQTMTEVAYVTDGAFSSTGVYGLVAPTSGNKTLAVSWTNGNETFIIGMSFTGVDQSTPFPHTATNAAQVQTVAVTSAVGNYVVGGLCMSTGGQTLTGTTLFNDFVHGAVINAGANYDAGAATVNIGTGTAGKPLAYIDVAAAGAGGGFFSRYYYDMGNLNV